MVQDSNQPKGELTIQIPAMPKDTNPNGDIFGGWLVSQMDLAALIKANQIAQGRAATIAIKGMNFKAPVHVGDTVSCYVVLKKQGTTSMTFEVEAWVNVDHPKKSKKVTEATFVFVAIDRWHRKRPINQAEEKNIENPPTTLLPRTKQCLYPTIKEEPALKTIAMPADTNPNRDIFGGWLVSQMDLAAGITAKKTANGRAATIAIKDIAFKEPVNIGDVLSCYVQLDKTGNTSMTFSVEAWVNVAYPERCRKVTQGTFVFVAIDKKHQKRPIHQHEEQCHYTFLLLSLIGLATSHVTLTIGLLAAVNVISLPLCFTAPLLLSGVLGIGFFKQHQTEVIPTFSNTLSMFEFKRI